VAEAMPARLRAAAELLAMLLLLVYCAILLWYGGSMSWTALASGDRSSSLVGFPLWIPYAFIPLGALALALQCLVRAADAWQQLRTGVPAQGEEG